jgi:hypothetical protein
MRTITLRALDRDRQTRDGLSRLDTSAADRRRLSFSA